MLYILPAAAGEEGVGLEELARRLGVPRERVLRDLEVVTNRVFYHPAGGADDLQILLEADRVRVRSGGEFRRPTKLTPREMLALHLGLRMLGAERPAAEQREGERPREPRAGAEPAGAEPAGGDQAGGERRAPEIEALARRLETELAAAPAEAFRPRISVEEDAGGGGNEIRALLCEAARECCRCRLRYLKPGTTEPESREVDPYVLVHATGQWYVLGHCPERDAVRAFRLDRIVAAEVLPERFEVPGDFDPAPYLEGGRVYRAEEEREVVIRYSASIARWMTERGWGLEQSDGSVVVSHRVADPGWAVRHILRYGPEAEVLAPSEIRGLVREAVRRLAG